ncbi:conserved hypothetical protein [Candidatus Desulfarcum epimagneticum]|uniref:Response regulatory domain-containing protein n=1 Tax=uncultured Desulfobacteraceae bacterium TaxID=218296 RepID=A0A484HNC2_9BACT|nr:conserved hypothetical protein [uncultured Desulfobacteraceae bacterium]
MKGNVLLVDDEIELIEELKWQLAGRAYHVSLAESGQKGLDILKKEPIEVMIVDIRMPGMNGIEVIELSREIAPDLQCIVATGYADIETAAAAMRLGAVNFLCKPRDVTVNVLDAAIQEAMSKLALILEVREKEKRIEAANRKLKLLNSQLEDDNQDLSRRMADLELRQLLAIVMDHSLQYYRLTTGKTKVDLAEESGVWALTQDINGLIPKTMNKYLKIDSIPKKRPNIRAVTRTGRFVLSARPLTQYPDEKKKLESLLEQLEDFTH